MAQTIPPFDTSKVGNEIIELHPVDIQSSKTNRLEPNEKNRTKIPPIPLSSQRIKRVKSKITPIRTNLR